MEAEGGEALQLSGTSDPVYVTAVLLPPRRTTNPPQNEDGVLMRVALRVSNLAGAPLPAAALHLSVEGAAAQLVLSDEDGRGGGAEEGGSTSLAARAGIWPLPPLPPGESEELSVTVQLRALGPAALHARALLQSPAAAGWDDQPQELQLAAVPLPVTAALRSPPPALLAGGAAGFHRAWAGLPAQGLQIAAVLPPPSPSSDAVAAFAGGGGPPRPALPLGPLLSSPLAALSCTELPAAAGRHELYAAAGGAAEWGALLLVAVFVAADGAGGAALHLELRAQSTGALAFVASDPAGFLAGVSRGRLQHVEAASLGGSPVALIQRGSAWLAPQPAPAPPQDMGQDPMGATFGGGMSFETSSDAPAASLFAAVADARRRLAGAPTHYA